MTTNYVLIDFENVQPDNIEALKQEAFNVRVFVGASQAKLSVDLVVAMQAFDDAGQFIRITGSGNNALDFHIAYYVGELVGKEPGACFYIVSRDKGFDPLVEHLKSRKVRIQRVPNLGKIPGLKVSPSGKPASRESAPKKVKSKKAASEKSESKKSASKKKASKKSAAKKSKAKKQAASKLADKKPAAPQDDKQVAAIVKKLQSLGQSLPQKVKGLSNTINSLFPQNLSEQQRVDLVKKLEHRKYIKIDNGNVTYNLPKS